MDKNELQLNNPRIIRAWCMFDWANSVYSLVITTAIFPLYYKAVAESHKGSDVVEFLGFTIQNSVLYSYALSFSFLIVAAMLPLLSGAADYSGNKKAFMKFFVWLGGLSCIGLYFFTNVSRLEWGIICSVLASIGYSGSLVFYDAYLPEIVTKDRYDQTSAKGYSMGYYGSVILMIICLVLIMNYTVFGFKDEGQATRFSFLMVGVWWIGFSFIPFSILPDKKAGDKTQNLWSKGYEEIRKVWGNVKHQPDLKRFLLAYFFYNMGVQTVMYLASLFGTDVLHLKEQSLILTVLIIQLVGALGAWVFAMISRAQGNRFAIIIMIAIWIGICISAYFIMTEFQFFILAFVVGMVMGGIQSLSRATYSKLIPEDTVDTASYFSFYDVVFNVSVVLGTFSYGFINQITGSMRYSALGLAVFFIIGMVVFLTIKSGNIAKQVKR
ncbi:MAG TPA: MFS transporter [Cyclobacteriaceae bacterium]|jgi:UMF1 family MFS transporter|nr:MFS transporter [Cyclobacteriaceae bacterium]